MLKASYKLWAIVLAACLIGSAIWTSVNTADKNADSEQSIVQEDNNRTR